MSQALRAAARRVIVILGILGGVASAHPSAQPATYCSGTTTWEGIWGGDYRATYPTDYDNTYDTNCNLGYGATGPGVRALQMALNLCYGARLTVDGDWGDSMQAAFDSMRSEEAELALREWLISLPLF